MANIGFKYDDGITNLEINNDPNRVLKVNLADIGIVDRAEASLKKLKEKIEAMEKDTPIDTDGTATDKTDEIAVKTVRDLNAAMRESFDEVFYPGASDIVFGVQNPISLAGGRTIFENFMYAFIDFMKPYVEAEKEKSMKNIEKYKAVYDA